MKGNALQCPCCKIYYQGVKEPGQPYTRALTAPGVCEECDHHQGDRDDIRQHRGKHHGKMLRHAYETMRDRLAATRQEVIQAQRELEARPTRVLVRIENLDKMIVTLSHKERDEAYERRDKAMGALSDLLRMHHQDPENPRRCSCGDLFDKCQVAQVVKWPSIASWEAHQFRLSEQGERHYLDRNHPVFTDPTWFLTRYEPRFEDPS